MLYAWKSCYFQTFKKENVTKNVKLWVEVEQILKTSNIVLIILSLNYQ